MSMGWLGCFLFAVLGIAVGKEFLRVLGISVLSGLEQGVFAAVSGWGIMTYGILILGWSGLLYRPLAWVILVYGLWFFHHSLCNLCLQVREGIVSEFRQKNVVRRLTFSLFFLLTLMNGVLIFLPAYGGDPLCYHLGLPQVFVKQHAITYLPYTANSTSPFFMEMLYTLGLLLDGASAAQWFHWVVGIAGALGLVAGTATLLPGALRWLPAVLFLITPGIFHQLPTASNDAAMAVYIWMGFLALSKSLEQKKKPWFFLSGALFGFALSIKLISAIYIAAAVIWWVLVSFLDSRNLKNELGHLGLWLFGIFLFSGVWYLRSYWDTGNPVYPYFERSAGSLEVGYNLAKHGLGKGLRNFLLLPWHLTMAPEAFGGRGNQLGPIYLAFLPGLVLLPLKKEKVFIQLLLFVGIGVSFWFLGPQNQRFLFPLIPFLVLLLAKICEGWGMGERKPTLFARSAAFIFSGFVALQGVSLVRYEWKLLPAALGIQSSTDFLQENERSYPASELVNEKVQTQARILSQEIRGFYFKPEMIREDMFRRQTGYLSKFQSSEEGLHFLKEKGITHLLTVDAFLKDHTPALFHEWGFQATPEKYFEFLGERNTVFEGQKLRYGLYRIKD